MGRIYLGHAGGDGPTAAVKTLLPDGELDVTDRRRFAREVKVAQRVSSSHTARVLDADPDAEQPWNQLRIAARARELVDEGTPIEAACRIIVLEDQLEEAQRFNTEYRRGAEAANPPAAA
ncbi:hypothetical protein [Streptomyces sp. NPDC096323]|uniref:hypothetical protein n=1 Tax=Streptomyces sp. NPDC096323 TaxID=3155822 RepID=UPI00331869C7